MPRGDRKSTQPCDRQRRRRHCEVQVCSGKFEGEIASFIADGAYNGEPVYQAVTRRQPDPSPDVVIPPRASAVLSPNAVDPQNQRGKHV
jgi:hypothetical protein